MSALSYDFEGASAATGLSTDVLRRAMRAGDLQVRYVRVGGRHVAKPLILADELARFLRQSDTELPSKSA